MAEASTHDDGKRQRRIDRCPSHPDRDSRPASQGVPTHECMEGEYRCAYCAVRLLPENCRGCGRFLTPYDMAYEARCSECGG